ncbi:MAG: 50S ribosomal protein L29 [Alphaproteobacteria bacterium]|nr:50S ribosomal protein L29 [Alphaproteobacteria bacterium]
MKQEELKGKTQDELKEMIGYLKKELLNLRFQKASGELANSSRFSVVKKNIARIQTYLNSTKSAA